MKCTKCIRAGTQKLVDKWFCDKHFCDIVEQSVRRHLRKYGIRRDARLSVSDKACAYMIKQVVKVPVRIVKGQGDFLVMPWTLDDENEEFLKWVIENRKTRLGENKKIIKLFYPVSKKDISTYFKIKKVPYKVEKTRINSLLDKIEDKHPGTKRSLLKSRERL